MQKELAEKDSERKKADGEVKEAQRRLKIISAALGGAHTGAGA
jgi:hypothetical protein